MSKFVCFHGHFYQPPREDPWLEQIEFQETALPYHDWNERITAECYLPNAYARRLDSEGFIIEILNNYEEISFNFGPTLLRWFEKHKPDILKKIVQADKKSCFYYNGHGNAIAQVYNHIIMPLATTKDKITQIRWGIEAFKYFFGRSPEGMWLPETAVDNETLALMAKEGIKFTILAPKQALKIRPLSSKDEKIWCQVEENTLDIAQPYRCYPTKDTSIDIFFYHGPLSHGIAFGNLLHSGEIFAKQIEAAFSKDEGLISIVTDGETFGHHWKFGEMALAYAIYYFSHHSDIKLTNFSYFLSQFPPKYEVVIKENTAWSCAHGLGRWERDCGCCTGFHPEWHQKWRRPFRDALNWLRDKIHSFFEEIGSQYFHDPWAARDDYIKIVLNPSFETKEEFWQKHSNYLPQKEKTKALKLLEMQYYSQLMFTSCGWFFDDISGLEAKQNLRYAARAIQLAKDFNLDLEKGFLKILKKAKSNLPEYGDGAQIYQKQIRPHLYDFQRIAVHFSFNHLLKEPLSKTSFYTLNVEVKKHEIYKTGGNSLLFEHLLITHQRTEEKKEFLTVILHLGGLDLIGTAFSTLNETIVENYKKLFQELAFYQIKAKLEKFSNCYKIQNIFLDDRRKLALKLLKDKLETFENTYASFYQENKSLMLSLKQLHIPLPEGFLAIAKTVLSKEAYKECQKKLLGKKNYFKEVLEEAKMLGLKLDTLDIKNLLEDYIKTNLKKIKETFDFNVIKQIQNALDLYQSLSPQLDLCHIQNDFWDTIISLKAQLNILPKAIISLGEKLKFRLEI